MSTLSDIRSKVIALVKDDSGKLVIPASSAWVHGTVYAAGALVVPLIPNGHFYICSTHGTSGATEPTWPLSGTVTDGTAVWTEAPDDYNRLIAGAIQTFSRHRPNTSVVDITGNNTHDYALPTGWVDEFSGLVNIEYPLGDVPETLIDNDDYGIYQAPSGKLIRLSSDTPAVSETLRVTFTIPRTESAIPQNDVDAFCYLSAALCLEELANIFTQTSDSTISADVVNYRSKSSEFAARAKRYMAIYKEHIGIKDDDSMPAASAVTDMDMKYPGGLERLTHPRILWRNR